MLIFTYKRVTCWQKCVTFPMKQKFPKIFLTKPDETCQKCYFLHIKLLLFDKKKSIAFYIKMCYFLTNTYIYTCIHMYIYIHNCVCVYIQ